MSDVLRWRKKQTGLKPMEVLLLAMDYIDEDGEAYG